MLCTKHLRENATDYLQNTVRLNQAKRTKVSEKIFGKGGLTGAESLLLFDERAEQLAIEFDVKLRAFSKYFRSHLTPLLRENVVQPIIEGKLSSLWTNNNAESLNHVLKQLVNWKPQPLHQLVTIISKHRSAQYADIERAFIGRGDYRLTSKFKSFSIEPHIYASKTKQECMKIKRRFFFNSSVTEKHEVVSSNKKLRVPRTPSSGKKPHQKRPKAAEKTIEHRRND